MAAGGGGGGGYPSAGIHGKQDQEMVEEYRDLGMKHVKWMKKYTDVMKKKIFPSTFSEIKVCLENFTKFQTEKVPESLKIKKRILQIFDELQEHGAGAYSRSIDASIHPNHIQDLWSRLEMEMRIYEADLQTEVTRLQILQNTFESFLKNAQTLEGSIDDIRYSIKTEAERLGKVHKLEIKQKCDELESTLNGISTEVISLEKLVRFLEDGRYPDVDQLYKKVQSLQTKVSQTRTDLNSSVIQKLNSGLPVTAQMTRTSIKFSQEQLIEAKTFFQHVEHCLQWIEDKKASLQTIEYSDDPFVIKQALEQHQKKHDEILNFKTEVDKCIAGRVSLTSEEQKVCTDLLSKVHMTFPVLKMPNLELEALNLSLLNLLTSSVSLSVDTSAQQLRNLQSLQEFLLLAIKELTWLKNRTEETYKCSSETSMPFQETLENLRKAWEARRDQITSLQTKGYTMVNMNHPASKILKDYNAAIQYYYSWLLELLKCLPVHVQNLLECNRFFDHGRICQDWMILQTTTLKKWMMCQIHSFEELQMMKREFQDLQMNLPEYEKNIVSLSNRSCKIIPLKQRGQQVTSAIKVQCLCLYKQPSMSFYKGEMYTLIDNSQKTRWKVKNAKGEVEIPSVCLQILPPNVEAVDLADRLNEQLDELKKLIFSHKRNLTEKSVLSQIQGIKNLDVKQFQLLDLAQQNDLLRNLNDEAAELLVVVESDKKVQLQKELKECKQKYSDLTRELQEKEASKRNDPPVNAVKSMESIRSSPPLTKNISSDEQRVAPETQLQSVQDFSCKWNEFKLRFEFGTGKTFFKSNDFTIKEISPVTMQYIAGTKDERDSLTQKLRKKNLSGIFECGLLRIILQGEGDMARMKEDPDDNSHLAEEVIAILKSHIHTQPAIIEKIVSQVVWEDVKKAQELGHLECLKSSRAKIYIKKSGKDISIVGREVEKSTESIFRVLDQRKRNEPISRTVKHETDVSETKRSIRRYDSDGVCNQDSLEHPREKEKELKKHGEASEHRMKIKLTASVIQMLVDSNYAEALSTAIPEVAVHYISNEVVFQGPPEAVMKAECHLKQYLMSKGFWHEVDQTELEIEISKRLNFEYYLKKKNHDVHIKFLDKKIVFLGNKSKESFCSELCQFKNSTNTKCIKTDSFIVSYLKLHNVQKYIWEQFENRHIRCFWQVMKDGINVWFRNDEDFDSAQRALEKCIAFSKLSFEKERDLQDFETCPDMKDLIHQNAGMIHKEVLQADCVIYVGMPEVASQIKELYDRHMIAKRNFSSQLLLSYHLLTYVRKYLLENMKKNFDIDIQELDDLSGIKILGAEDNVQNAISKVQEQVQKIQIYTDSLEIPELTNAFARQVKDIVATVEEENKTVIDVIYLPGNGKVIKKVQLNKVLDVSLVYGSTPGKNVDMQLIPVSDNWSPLCLAAIDLMKGDLQEKTAAAFQRYIDQKGNKPEDFSFTPYDEDNSQHIVYFVMPTNPISWMEKFKQGLYAVFDYAFQNNMASLSIPVEMHEKLPVRQTSTIILETLDAFLAELTDIVSFRHIYLCSVEKCSQSVLIQILDSVVPNDLGINQNVEKEDDSYYIIGNEDKQVNITIVVGSLLDQQVDVIVNSASRRLSLEMGSLSKTILNAAGMEIQDECRRNYPEGIEFGEVAVTSPGRLNLKKIFHGALSRVDIQTSSHLLVLRSLMKNCLKQAESESCHSIAFPALGIGALNYPFETVAKEMFWAVTSYAKQYGVSDVKFVMPEDDKNVYTVFKQMENNVNNLLQAAQDYWPIYDISFEGCGVKVDITDPRKLMCDVDVYLGKPKASVNAVKFPLFDSSLAKEETVTVNNDPKNWNERLYLCLDNMTAFKEVIYHALLYVKQMKLTSMCIYLDQIKKESPSKLAIQDVIYLLAKYRLTLGELERVLIVVSDDVLQKLTPWFEENVKASQSGRSYAGKLLNLFVHQVQVTWRKLQPRCPETCRTHIRIIGPAYPEIKSSHEAVEKKTKELIDMEKTKKNKEEEGTSYQTPDKARSHGVHPTQTDSPEKNELDSKKNKEEEGTSYQTPDKARSHGVHPTQTDSPEKNELDSKKNKEEEGTSYQTPDKARSHGVHPTQTDSPEKNELDSKVYLNFKTEVAKKVLDLIISTTGKKGISALVTDLRTIAEVYDSDDRIIIHCDDFQNANFINTCVINHIQEARKVAKASQDTTKKHLIDGGNADTKELLQFEYSYTNWVSMLSVEEGKLYLLGTLQMKEEVVAAVQTVNKWLQEDLYLNSDEQQKAAEALSVVKNEFPAVFIKQTGDRITIKGDNTDSFEKAKHRAKVTLGKIKITSRGRRRNLNTDGEFFSSLLHDHRMDEVFTSQPSDLQASQNRAVITSKTYHTREGIAVKVYIGDIVRLPVDCIVNAANKNLSHGGGVALAIAKAAGREFDQESEAYVRRYGIIPVTQCCVTSAGRLHYRYVIHVVGPQWHDYKQNEKDRCGDDLKKTIVNCLIEANKLSMTSIAVTSISSEIFGVPKNMCAQMYVEGVVEFSRTCNLQSNSVQEIHFVDMLPEMCHLTQLAFDAELNSVSNNELVVDTTQSRMKNLSPRKQELPPVKTQSEASATIKPLSYAEVTAEGKGSKQNPYVINPWDHTTILIYNHDITNIVVDAVVCPVFPNVEDGVAKSLKRACGSEYTNGDYKRVMGSIRREGETYVTNTPASKPDLPFHHIIHIYSPRWIGLEQHKHRKNFCQQIKSSLKKIHNEAMTLGIASIALPVLGIGDSTTPVKLICEYMMDGVLTVCSDPLMLPVNKMTIHLVTNETSLAHQLKEIACQQFGQKLEVSSETLQNANRCVKLSEHAQEGLKVTIKNDSALNVSYKEPPSNHLHGSKRGQESQNETCPICLATPVDPKALNGCGHILCRECMEFTVKAKPVCPVCGKIYGILTGNQPQGTMDVKTFSSSLPGFKSCGTVDILYSFPGGIQTKGPDEDREPRVFQDESLYAWNSIKMEGKSTLIPEKTNILSSCPEITDLSEAYMECRTEVSEIVLNSIMITIGQKGIDSLISDLDQFAKVETCDGRVIVLCEYKHAENVQKCVKSHYNKATKERKPTEENKHLIHGGNENLKEWLQFAYGHTNWSKNLQLEEGKLYLTGTLQMKKEVEKAVHSMNYWYQEEFALSSEEQQKVDAVAALIKTELPAVFIRQTKEIISVLSDNKDNFERAKYKVKVALGRIKITARGRGHKVQQSCGISFSGMSFEDKMDASPKFPLSDFQSNQPAVVLIPKSYCTKEGLTVKVYLGNITSLPVDCIVNASNGLLSHDGGVALAISKAAGEGFDKEGEAYVRKHGPIPVTHSYVTSAGRLPCKLVIHAVEPQCSDYTYNEKDRCIDDLKKTIVGCLIKANKFKMVSIAIPPLSSGIFGVPKVLCAQMYAKGVIEYSKTYGLQSVKEIHFVDTVSEMCQLIQSVFDKELM